MNNIRLIIEKDLVYEIYQEEIESFKKDLYSKYECVEVFYTSIKNGNIVFEDQKENILNQLPQCEKLSFFISSGFNEKTPLIISHLEETNGLGLNVIVQPLLEIDFLSWHTCFNHDTSTVINNAKEIVVDDMISIEEGNYYKNEFIILPCMFLKNVEKDMQTFSSGKSIYTAKIKKEAIKNQQAQTKESFISPKNFYDNYCRLGMSKFSQYFICRESFSLEEALIIKNHFFPNADKRMVTALLLGGIVEKVKDIENTHYKFKEGIIDLIKETYGIDNSKEADKILSLYHMNKRLNNDLQHNGFKKKNKI